MSASQPTGMNTANVAEGAAASVSFLCLVHCLALPVLLLLLPSAIGLIVGSEAFHLGAVALVVPAAAVVFGLGYRKHRRCTPVALGIVGICCLVAALLLGLDEAANSYVMAFGSAIIIAGHALNWKHRARAR
jgi:hypothetical protein